MKKLLCILLSMLLVAFACLPAAAAELNVSTLPAADLADDGDGEYTVTFIQPSDWQDENGEYYYKDGYSFAISRDGDYEYIPDTRTDKSDEWKYENDYLYDAENDRYVLAKDVYDYYFPENPEYFTVKEMDPVITCAAGEIVTFKVRTSPKFNRSTVVVRANGDNVSPNVKGEYSVYVNQDMTINVVERNKDDAEVLLRNHYFVYLPKGEDGEYRCRTLENTNYKVVYYGDSFDFRLVLGKDAVVNNLSVSVTRGTDTLSEELGFDPGAVLGQLGIGDMETIPSYGTDATGSRLYRVDNVTTDIHINVSGVKTKESSDTLNLILRILRMILNLLGINLPFLQDMNVTHNVTINVNSNNLDYSVLEGATPDENAGNVYAVGDGDNLTLVVYKYDILQDVVVTWTPGNEVGGSYSSEWMDGYDQNAEKAYFYAIYNIDNITENTVVTVG